MKQLFWFFTSLLIITQISWAQDDYYDNPDLYKTEHIYRFHADIQVLKSRKVHITEHIRVHSKGVQMVHGIYRDLPLEYEFQGGVNTVDFKLLSVQRDGKAEPYFTEDMDNGIRIYIGSKDLMLENGDHEFVIDYEVDHVLGMFEQYDEFYWNINGNGWGFNIDTVSANIQLPAGAKLKQWAGYTGTFGQAGKDFSVDTLENSMYFETTRGFAPSENLTVAVGWNKGAIDYPTSSEELWYWIKTHLVLIIGLLGLIALFWHNFVQWVRYGKDPKPGTIMPQYGPPSGFSPGLCCYVHNDYGKTNVAFTAELVGIATKGHMDIEKSEEGKLFKKTSYTFTKKLDDKHRPLLESERNLMNDLFSHGDVVHFVERTYNPNLKSTMDQFTSQLGEQTGDKYIRKNINKKGAAFAYWFLLIVAMGLLRWWLGGPVWPIVLVAILGLIGNILFAYLINQPTELGRKIMDHLAGFKMYMEYADKERIRLNNPPSMNFEHYEANLPYAIALGVADKWTAQFDPKELERGFSTGHLWYGGMMAHGIHNMNFNEISTTISSASTPPGKSSGSGGGGFSGGGGGGGGGGGW